MFIKRETKGKERSRGGKVRGGLDEKKAGESINSFVDHPTKKEFPLCEKVDCRGDSLVYFHASPLTSAWP